MDREANGMPENELTDELLEDAEAWYQKVETGALGDELRANFKAWYDESVLHQQAYAQVFMCRDAGLSLEQKKLPKAANDNRRLVSLLGSIAAGLVVLVLGFFYYFLEPSFTEHSTLTAEIKTIHLKDGSTITLGASSRVLVADFGEDSREVILEQGEALFDVEHDKEKPFLVTSGDTVVQVLGTKFAVNSAINYVSVSLLEGKVNVRQVTENSVIPFLEEAAEVTLEPEQSVSVLRGILGEPKAKSIEQMDSWVDGTRSYFDVPLSLVVADINRYVQQPIHIANARTANLSVTLVFGLDQIDSVVQSLPQILPVSIVKRGTNTIIKQAD
ncbi:MAG: FecR domain-containing protein [Kordiimonas sp.]